MAKDQGNTDIARAAREGLRDSNRDYLERQRQQGERQQARTQERLERNESGQVFDGTWINVTK